jgi:hypothetical protein
VFWDFDITGLVRKKGYFGNGTLPRSRDERHSHVHVNGLGLGGATTPHPEAQTGPNIHEFSGKREAPMIEPIASEKVHQYALSGITLKGNLLVTSDYFGNIFVWESK